MVLNVIAYVIIWTQFCWSGLRTNPGGRIPHTGARSQLGKPSLSLWLGLPLHWGLNRLNISSTGFFRESLARQIGLSNGKVGSMQPAKAKGRPEQMEVQWGGKQQRSSWGWPEPAETFGKWGQGIRRLSGRASLSVSWQDSVWARRSGIAQVMEVGDSTLLGATTISAWCILRAMII